jgi:hypothetical protein
MPKGDKKYKKYLPLCNKFMEMFIISMIFRQQLRISDRELSHKSYNVGIMDMMIHRKNQFRVYVMAEITRLLMLKLVGSNHYHHQPLMMIMMKIIISRILVVTIPCLEVVYLPRSLGSGGGAANPHLHLPNKLLVEVILSPGEKLKSVERYKDALISRVREVISRGDVECKVAVSEKSVKSTITLENQEYLDQVKNILKIFQVETTKNGKQHMCKLSVKVVQPKKGDKYVDPKSLLPDFDPEILEKRKKSFGAGITYKEGVYSSFLRMDFLTCSGLFGSPYGIPYLKPPYGPVKDTRRVRVYSQKDTLGTGQDQMRIAHPDCPGITEKCLDMCKRWTSDLPTPPSEHGYVCMGMMDMPIVFLNTREFWVQGL